MIKRIDVTYSRVAIFLHWTIALLIIVLLVFGTLMTNPETPNRFVLYQWHKTGGIMVLLLSVLRLFWRLTHKAPALPSAMKDWEILAAKCSHIGFYVLMIGMPLLGWAMVSASPLGFPTKLFGTINWPHMPFLANLEVKEPVAKKLTQAHHLGGKLMIGLIGLHIGAALKHHFVNKDNVLARMVPFLRRRENGIGNSDSRL